MGKNQFRLADVILSVICVVFVAEAAAPVASIGNSQYFWWIFMILAFLLPYGLIAAELGTAYAGDGGLYDWIHAAYPDGKWAARASWYYWINFPLWMASLAVMCPELITFITGRSLGTFGSLVVELLFIWIVTLIVLSRVRQHHYPERERCHQDRAGAAGRRARRVVYQPLRLCQRHVGADISAVVRLKQPLVYLRHHLQFPRL